MKKNKQTLFSVSLSLLLLSGASNLMAEDNNKIKKQQEMKSWKNQIDKNRQAIRELLGVDMLGDVSKRFEQLMEKFGDQDMEKFFKDDHFDQFMDNWNPFEGLSDGHAHWMETPKERILIFKHKVPKNSPLDIKIQKGTIEIKGQSESTHEIAGVKSKSISSFEQSYSIPDDVDASKASFENKEGEVLIKLPKKVAGKTDFKKLDLKNQAQPYQNDKKEEDEGLKPLIPSEGDITI